MKFFLIERTRPEVFTVQYAALREAMLKLVYPLHCSTICYPDENAYSGAYYIKNGLKWIFNIQGLKKDLGVASNEQLSHENYDVETYVILENEPENIEMKQVYQDLEVEVESGEPVYLEGGMYLYPDGSIR